MGQVRLPASSKNRDDWPCSSESLEFSDPDQGPEVACESNVPSRGRSSRVCEEIEALIGGERLSERRFPDEGDIDFLRAYGRSSKEFNRLSVNSLKSQAMTCLGMTLKSTLMVLDSVLSTLTLIKEWDLSSERAASDRVSYMRTVIELEKDLGTGHAGMVSDVVVPAAGKEKGSCTGNRGAGETGSSGSERGGHQ